MTKHSIKIIYQGIFQKVPTKIEVFKRSLDCHAYKTKLYLTTDFYNKISNEKL